MHLTGWHVEPAFELVRGDRPVVLGALLAELAERIDVRVLVWAGAPVPVFHPTRREVADAVERLIARDPHPLPAGPARAPRPLPPREDDRRRRPGRVRRRHRPHRPGRRPLRLSRAPGPPPARLARRRLPPRGPAVADVAAHFAHALARGHRRARCRPPHAAAAARRREHRPGRPHGRRGHVRRACRTATSASSRPTCARCAPRGASSTSRTSSCGRPRSSTCSRAKLRDPPTRPASGCRAPAARARPTTARTTPAGSSASSRDADAGRGPLPAATIRCAHRRRDDPLYVHAKVGIVDDRWLTIGSANLNAHSLFNDTEMNVVTDDAALARATRAAPVGRAPRARAGRRSPERPRRRSSTSTGGRSPPSSCAGCEAGRAGHAPAASRCRGVSRRSRRLLGPLQGLVDDG